VKDSTLPLLIQALGSAAQNAVKKYSERTGATPETAAATFAVRARDGRTVRYRVRVERLP
jgi:hypothetical protein